MRHLAQYHVIVSLWLSPWSWNRPQWRRWASGEWTLCFGFGQIELMID